jgi:hypothetical protein
MKIRELFIKVGFDVDPKPLKQVETGLKGIKDVSKQVLGGAVAAGGALFGFAKSTADAGDQIAKTARKLGVGAEALQELRFAAGRAGVNTAALDVGLQRFTRRAAEAAKGGGSAKSAFDQLGIQIKDVNGNIRSADDLLNDVADGLKNTTDQSERVALAFKFFDTEGVSLVNLLQEGSITLQEFRDQARATGNVLSGQVLDDSEAFADNWQDFTQILAGAKNTIGAGLLPVVNKMLVSFRQWFTENRKIIKQRLDKWVTLISKAAKIFFGFLKVGINTIERLTSLVGGLENALMGLLFIFQAILALKIVNALGQMGMGFIGLANSIKLANKAALIFQLKIFAIGAAIVGLLLLVDDLIAFFKGQKSLLGQLLGEDKSQKIFQFVDKVKTSIMSIMDFFKNFSLSDMVDRAGEALDRLLAKLNPFKDIFNKFQNIPGIGGLINNFGGFFSNPLDNVPQLAGAGGGSGTKIEMNVSVQQDISGTSDPQELARLSNEGLQNAIDQANRKIIGKGQFR